jgi:hypothetical protein
MIVRLDSTPVLPKLPDARRLDEAEREVASRGTPLTAVACRGDDYAAEPRRHSEESRRGGARVWRFAVRALR